MPAPHYIVVAPACGEIPFIFPVGLIDLIGRAGRPVRGHYPDSLSDEEIKRAAVAVVPIHWYFSIRPAAGLIRRLKAVHPGLPVVSGGYTAGAWPKKIIEECGVDYVIRGDAEIPFAMLMQRLFDGQSVEDVPNLTWKQGETPLDYHVDEAGLASSENRDVSWFPEFEKAALDTQKINVPTFLFPWVVVSRGCSFPCPECYASPVSQQYLAGRGMVARPPASVRADLDYWSNRPDIRWCHFNSDFFSTLGASWTQEALDGKFDLTAYYEWYRLPRAAEARMIIERFSKVVFGLFHRPDSECAQAGTPRSENHVERLAGLLRELKGKAKFILYVTPGLLTKNPAFREETRRLSRVGGAWLKLYDETILPPAPGQPDREMDERYRHLSDASGAAVPRLARQHRLLKFVLLRLAPVYSMLWKISSLRVRLHLNAWTRKLFRA